MRITYTAFPPIQLFSAEAAKREVDIAGPIARTIDAASCARPLVAPSDCLLGDAALTYKNTQPDQTPVKTADTCDSA